MTEAKAPENLEYVSPTHIILKSVGIALEFIQEGVVYKLENKVEMLSSPKYFQESH